MKFKNYFYNFTKNNKLSEKLKKQMDSNKKKDYNRKITFNDPESFNNFPKNIFQKQKSDLSINGNLKEFYIQNLFKK